MASALASPPPPWSFGSADLKRNARKFFERALVISALVHLAAVGAFRAAEERSRARDVLDTQRIKGKITVIDVFELPPIRNWVVAPSHPSAKGVFFPVDKPKELMEITGPEARYTPEAVGIGPTTNNGAERIIDPGPPGGEVLQPFRHVDTPPTPKVAPKPPYPEWAKEARIEGTVLLRVLVGVDGIPKRVEVVRGPNGLKEEAAKAVARWIFDPGLSDHQPIEVWVQVPITFRLSE